MDKMDCEVDDVVVVENPETVSKSLKTSERGLKRIIINEEAKKRTKYLFEKAMLREKKKKLLKGHEILDCHIVEMNDSNDFSHQSKLLRTERVNRKPKTQPLPIPSTSSVSEEDVHSIGPSSSKRFKDSKFSNAEGREGLSHAQSNKDGSQGQKKCRLCHKDFADSALKDHMISCMKQTYERDVNSLQKENLENKPCSFEEVTKCHICGKDMSFLSSASRTSHINICLDQEENEKKQREEHEKQLQEAQSVILNCPVCQKKFRSTLSRTKHLKKCALSNNMSVEEIKNLARQQQEEFKKQLDAGILPENIKESLLKKSKGKSKAKKRICEGDEDLQLALALSTSITEEKKLQASSHHSASSSKLANLLLDLPKSQAEERISERAASLIFSPSPPEGSVSQTPAFKRRKQASDSHELNKFWDKTSLASPVKSTSPSTLTAEQEQSKLQSSSSTPYSISSVSRDVYYVPVLMPPVTVDNSNVGSKLKSVSAIPGRQRSMDGQGRQREVEVSSQEAPSGSNSEVESTPQIEVHSQTVVNLVELAAQNEEADSQSSDNFSSPLFLSPDVKERMEVDALSDVASHQPEVASCELKKLSSSFLSLVNCPKHSDVQIATSHGELVAAHKIVLFVRCPRLYEMCDGGTIDFSSYSKESVLSLLKYVYGGEISVTTESVQDMIKLSSSLCLPLLLEKAEEIRNANEKPSSLNKQKADNACLIEDQCPDSFEEEEGEPADKANSRDQDARISFQSLGDLDENVISFKFNEDDGNHMEHVSQLECSVEQDLRSTNQNLKIPGDDEMHLENNHTEDRNALLAQKSPDNADDPVENQAIDGQQMDISHDDGHKQSKTDMTVSNTNHSICKLSSAFSESLGITKSNVDAQSHKDKICTESEDDGCSISRIEVKDPSSREGMHKLVASWKKCLADTICHSSSPKVEVTEAHSVDDVVSPINEHSDPAVDTVPNVEIQSTFQLVTDQQILTDNQFDKEPIFTQFNEPLQLPDSEIAQSLSNNQVPLCHNEIENISSVPIQELTNTSAADGLNGSIFQTNSSVPLEIKKRTKSKGRSKKVSAKEFKDLMGKAADGSLTDKDFEKITIKIEQDHSLFGKDVYIPLVLEDANLSSPSELEITDSFIPPKRFKSKKRCQSKDKRKAELPVTKPANVSSLTEGSSNPLQSLSASKTSFCIQNNNVNVREDVSPLASKLSTSYNSDALYNSDDDLFGDIEEGKGEKLTTYSTSGAVCVSIGSDIGSLVGSLTKIPNDNLERDNPERNKANPNQMLKGDKNIHLNSIVNDQDTQLSTNSEMMQMELASAIVADIQSIRRAEELSQSDTNPRYAESTPGSEAGQINKQSLQEHLPNNITPIKKLSASDSPNLNSKVGSSGKKKTQRGLTRIKNHTRLSSPKNSTNIPTTNCSDIEILSDSSCSGSKKDKDDSENRVYTDGKNTLNRSDKDTVDDVIAISDRQLKECRRNLDFDGRTTTEINEALSHLSYLKANQNSSLISTMPSSAATERSDPMDSHESSDPLDQSTAFMDGLMQCYTSKLTNSTVPHRSMVTGTISPSTSKLPSSTLPHPSELTSPTISCSSKLTINSSVSHSSKLSSSTVSSANLKKIKPKIFDNLYGSRQAPDESSSNSLLLSSTPKSATTSRLLPSTSKAPDAKHQQTKNKDAATPPSLTKRVVMAYSPVIKKGKGALTSAMTEVSGKLPNNFNDDQNRNNCPLSSLFIDSVATAKNETFNNKTTTSESEGSHKSHRINKRGGAGMDLASDSVSLSEAKDPTVPLRERLGIANPFGLKTKQLQSTAGQNVRKSDKVPPSLAEAGVSTLKRSMATQKESTVYVDKKTKNQQVSKSATPRGQMISKEKKQQHSEPSPFSPMPPYDEMNTPQLKKEVSKIGVRPMNKKRMNMLLKEVYRETHQYETDSDYEPTPVKQKCLNAPSLGVAPANSGSQSLPEDASFDSHGGGEGSSSGPAGSCLTKFVPPASSSGDADCDVNEVDDPLNSSQESSNSDVEDLAEESILQGWPEEEEINPTQMTQSSSETITERLLAFLRSKDLYEKILMYEPLELDVLKKSLTEAGIKIAMAKLMDFLDEQCITFSMKNMSNRNNRPQKGRGRPAKTT